MGGHNSGVHIVTSRVAPLILAVFAGSVLLCVAGTMHTPDNMTHSFEACLNSCVRDMTHR